jgi:hypothetical protein
MIRRFLLAALVGAACVATSSSQASVCKALDFSSETEYACGAGAVMGGVALRGTVAKVP